MDSVLSEKCSKYAINKFFVSLFNVVEKISPEYSLENENINSFKESAEENVKEFESELLGDDPKIGLKVFAHTFVEGLINKAFERKEESESEDKSESEEDEEDDLTDEEYPQSSSYFTTESSSGENGFESLESEQSEEEDIENTIRKVEEDLREITSNQEEE